jgi:hypothetical protein
LYNHYLAIYYEKALNENKIIFLPPDLEREKFSRAQDSLLKAVSLKISEIVTIAKKIKRLLS